MDESSGRRPRGAVPLGLIGMLALVGAIDWGYVRPNPRFQSEYALSWRFAAEQAHSPSVRAARVLGCGDSLIKFGVVPGVLAARTGLPTVNLAAYSASPVASYVLLRRALDAGACPQRVIVDFTPGILVAGPASTRNFPWADLLTWREAAALAARARDASLFGRIALGKVLASYRDRFQVRASVRSRIDGHPDAPDMIALFLRRNWRTNGGAEVRPKTRPLVIEPPRDTPAGLGYWQCDPVNLAYLRGFLDLAESYAIDVVWLIPPVHPGHQAVIDHAGDEAHYNTFARAEVARRPRLRVLDARHSGYGADLFFDAVHLDRDGGAILSATLAETLTQPPSPGIRWQSAPPPGTSPAGIALEDFAASERIVRTRIRSLRR